MGKLFCDRYLLARYDNNDRCVAVGESPYDVGTTYSTLSHKNSTIYFGVDYKIYLIDCMEQHEDIFQQEDKTFLEEMDYRNKSQKVRDYAIANNIHFRSAWRYLQRGKISEKEL